jgi:predicted signal transduction protein with EAL and GGDEF domain
MQVLAEGVETQDQLHLLRGFGCDRVQGYLFSRPIPARDMVLWLNTHRSSLVRAFSESRQVNLLKCTDDDELKCSAEV